MFHHFPIFLWAQKIVIAALMTTTVDGRNLANHLLYVKPPKSGYSDIQSDLLNFNWLARFLFTENKFGANFLHLSQDLFLPELFAPYLFWKCAPWLSTHKDEFGVANLHVWGLCGHWQQVCCCQTFGSKQVATKEDLTKILPQRVSFPTHPITGSQHLLLWTSEHQPPVPSWQLRNDSEQISIRCIAQQQEGGDFSPFERY